MNNLLFSYGKNIVNQHIILMFEGACDMSLFITFEGGEGSGKTTIAKMLHKQFIEEGYNITFSREPGGVDIAEQIRDVILMSTIRRWMQELKHYFMQQAEDSI